ncbi:hypothetical protein AB0I82_16910 [Streptomyces sp. NPDC050315]|uniref:hypothetical protein n=1 Tax=Streptomyces sp. NPDC050315 TaxID=3155039 RepID=UPI00342C0078
MEPLLELVLLVLTGLDLRNGAQADWKHGPAAVYLGITVAYGHCTVRWADGQYPSGAVVGERPRTLTKP